MLIWLINLTYLQAMFNLLVMSTIFLSPVKGVAHDCDKIF